MVKVHKPSAAGAGQAPAGQGSNPPDYHYQNNDEGDTTALPVPWWFNPTTAELFRNVSLEDEDIIVSSGVKMGTTWLTRLLVSLLFEYDDEGNLIPDAVDIRHKIPGRHGQTYPDAMYPTRAEKEEDSFKIYERMPEGRKELDEVLGDFIWEDFVNQPKPRMIATHLFGRRYLPKELFDDKDAATKGKGRLIVVVRNLKDTLISLHNFRGTAIDGLLGNEHGPGSFHRFLNTDDCPNAMGSAFHWVRENDKVVESIGNERALVVYYEQLIMNFGAQLKRINEFLGLGYLTDAKARAIEEACSFKTMEGSSMRTSLFCRKGGIFGWKDNTDLEEEQWAEFDRTFNKVLGGSEIAEPMRFFQRKDVPGMPPASLLTEGGLNSDPRDWPPYLLVMLKEGMVVSDPYFLNKERPTPMSEFSSPPSLKFDETNNDGSPRFHLFLASSCPRASSVCAVRTLLGLENVLSMDIADGQSGTGWVCLSGASCSPWKARDEGPFWLYEAYQLADALCTTQINVPVLWDTVTQQIVSNDSWEIMKLMSDDASKTDLCAWNDALGVIAKEGLFPGEMAEDIENMQTHLQDNLINPTENAGVEYMRNGHKESMVLDSWKKVFAALEELEGLLGQKRFLIGNNVTGVDIYLALFLFCLDACYWEAFGLRYAQEYKGSILTGDGYSNLKAFSREMYRLLKSTLNFASFKQNFRMAQAVEFTRQSYSSDKPSAEISTNALDEIVASLEKPAGERPTGPVKQSAPCPQSLTCEGVPMPGFFRQDAWQLYRNLDVREDDIILSSGVKMGTTWVTKIVNSLLHDFDDNGNTTDVYADDSYPNRLGQTYPEAMPPTREVERREMEEGKGQMREMIKTNFGDFTVDELLAQPSPRLFSSHLFGQKLLPKKLFDGWEHNESERSVPNGVHSNKGKGRLIVVMRNLKDSLVSLHHFRGVPKDGWYGNEHGSGSFRRWVDLETCPNSFGNAFQWVKMSADALDAIGHERALVIYYEALKSNFDAQLKRINDFLGLPRLTEAKVSAIRDECSAKSMSSKFGGRFKKIIRKASVKDWTKYLDEERWEEVDRTFNKALNGVELADPLRFFQFRDIPGMPLISLKECDLNTDPRSWPPYLLVVLKEGMIVPDPYFLNNFNCTSKANAAPTLFKSTIRPGRYLRIDETNRDGSPRFHLFIAGACPLASSAAAARTLLGLENMISMDIACGRSGAGWVFLNGVTCAPWKEQEGPFWLYEAYQLADPLCTTSISVPILWDTETHKIVSNDSWEIMKLMSDAATDLGLCSCPKDVLGVIAKQDDKNNIPTLFPEEENIDQMLISMAKPLQDAVYGAGFEFLRNGCVETQPVLEGRRQVFAKLEELDKLLGSRRYLVGNRVTGVDVRLVFCLLQFDACYLDLFGLRASEGYRGPILTSDVYPNLKAYTRDLYRLVKPAVYLESFRQLYQMSQAIEFTRFSYSCSVAGNKAMTGETEEELPDLHEILAALESSS